MRAVSWRTQKQGGHGMADKDTRYRCVFCLENQCSNDSSKHHCMVVAFHKDFSQDVGLDESLANE